MYAELVAPVVAAVIYSLYTYSGKYIKDGDKFILRKFLRTVFIGLVVGAAVVATGQEVSLNNFESVAASVGAVHFADVFFATAWERAVRAGFIPKSWTGEVEMGER